MKRYFVILCAFFLTSVSFGQEQSPEIEKVLEWVTLAPGLKILDVTELPHDGVFVDFETNEKIQVPLGSYHDFFWSPPGKACWPISEDILLFLVASDEEHENLFFYQIGKGARKAATIKKNPDHNNYPWIIDITIVSYINNVLTINYGFHESQSSPTQTLLIRITGDWKSLGIDVPETFVDVDVDNDGTVGRLDLLRFIEEWKKQRTISVK